jgi:hypothetical protein
LSRGSRIRSEYEKVSQADKLDISHYEHRVEIFVALRKEIIAVGIRNDFWFVSHLAALLHYITGCNTSL